MYETSKQLVQISQRFVRKESKKLLNIWTQREMDLSTAGEVEDESCWRNHSRAHFLPPALWDEVNYSCSRLMFNRDLFLKHVVPLIHSSNGLWNLNNILVKKVNTLKVSRVLLCNKMFPLSRGTCCISQWWKQRQNGVRDLCKNHKYFTGKTWESGLLSNSSKKKKNLAACVVTEKLILLPPGGGLLVHAGDEPTLKMIKGSVLQIMRVHRDEIAAITCKV